MASSEFKLFAEPEYLSKKGVADGYAGLDSGGRVPVGQLPDVVTVGGMRIRGAWDPTSTADDGVGGNPVLYEDLTFRDPGDFNIGSTGDDVPAVGDFWVASASVAAYDNGAVGGDAEIHQGDSIVITEVTENSGQYTVVYQQIGGAQYVTSIGDQSGAITSLNYDNLNIANGEIPGDKLVGGSVGTSQLTDGGVTSGKIQDGTIATGDIANDAITADKIADDAVTIDQMATLSVGTEQLQGDCVDDTKIADNAIQTEHIADSNVTLAKLGTGSVDATKIIDGEVGEDELADLAVTNVKIANLTIESGKLAANSVTAGKIQNDAVTTLKIKAGVVNNSHLAHDAVDTDQLADNAVDVDRLASDAVTTIKIADFAVTGAKVAADTITQGNMSDFTFDLYNTPNFTNTAIEMSSNLANLTVGYDADEYQNYYLLQRGNVAIGTAIEVDIYMQMVLPARFYTFAGNNCQVSALVKTLDSNVWNGSVTLEDITKVGTVTSYLTTPVEFVGATTSWTSTDATSAVPTDSAPVLLHFTMNIPSGITEDVRFYGARIRMYLR